jgi:metal-dependent amidase/aminoacylase/carboxypeptidase family protein
MAVPSEEPIELGWRQEMREKGKLSFLGGKQEFIKAGKFDEIDIALIDHMIPGENYKIAVRGMERIGVGGDGFIAKMVTFRGVEAHSGGNPWSGVNALNAAVIGLIGIHSQRETFRDADAIRIHQVLSKGGDSLNVVPSDVEMEMMIRGASVEAIKDACIKVDRALQGGAMAVGAEVEITNIPGYLPMPQQGTPELSRLIFRNAVTLLGEKNVISGMPSDDPIRVPTGVVADTRDVANIIPLAGLGVSGIRGRGHSREYYIGDKENAFVNPAKIYAMTIIDLLYEGAVAAKRVIDEYKPMVLKEKYVDHWKDIISDK